MKLTKHRWSLDRVEIYSKEMNMELLKSMKFDDLKNEDRALWTRRYHFKNQTFYLVRLDPR